MFIGKEELDAIEKPERFSCEKDIEDTYAAFELAANEYVRARLPFDHPMISPPTNWRHARRFFTQQPSVRYVSDHQIEQLGELGIKGPVVYVQAAINAIRDLRQESARSQALLKEWIAAATSMWGFGRVQQEPTPKRLREAIVQACDFMSRTLAAEVLAAKVSELLDAHVAHDIDNPDTCGVCGAHVEECEEDEDSTPCAGREARRILQGSDKPGMYEAASMRAAAAEAEIGLAKAKWEALRAWLVRVGGLGQVTEEMERLDADAKAAQEPTS